MKTVLLFLWIAMLMAMPISAQTYVYCPDNLPGTGSWTGFPMAGYAGLKIQELIPASLLPNSKCRIVDIAFAEAVSATYRHQQFQVRMAQTSRNALSATLNDNLGLCPVSCYLGSHVWGPTTANQWNDIGLTSSFAYDPNDSEGPNLVIEYRKRGGTWSPPGFLGQRIGGFDHNYNSSADPWTATTRQGNNKSGPKVRLRIERTIVLAATRKVSVGSSGKLALVNAPLTTTYQMATSFGDGSTTGGIPLGTCTVWLDLDSLMVMSVSGLAPTVFVNYSGSVSGTGTGDGVVNVPNIPLLVGLNLYHAAITLGITIQCSNTCCTVLTT